MRATIDTLSGKRFLWNDTVSIEGVRVPARYTTRSSTHLHPSRVSKKLLAELNGKA